MWTVRIKQGEEVHRLIGRSKLANTPFPARYGYDPSFSRMLLVVFLFNRDWKFQRATGGSGPTNKPQRHGNRFMWICPMFEFETLCIYNLIGCSRHDQPLFTCCMLRTLACFRRQGKLTEFNGIYTGRSNVIYCIIILFLFYILYI